MNVKKTKSSKKIVLKITMSMTNGRKHHHGVLDRRVHVNDFLSLGNLLQLADLSLQTIILESMFSFSINQRNRTH